MLTFLKKLASAIPVPGKGKVTLYVSDTGVPGYKDETGEAHTLAGADGLGVPAGGTTAQVLRKSSDEDNATEWHTLTAADISAASAEQGAKADAAAVDAAVVHSTGDEYIYGFKTWEGNATSNARWNVVSSTKVKTGSIIFGTPGGSTGIQVLHGNWSGSQWRHDIRAGQGQWSFLVSSTAGSSPSAGIVLVPTVLRPVVNNSMSLGAASQVWTQVYATNATISTSDERLKTDLRAMTDAEVAAFAAIARLPNVWRWSERAESEGAAARLHAGPTVQAALKIMEAHGLNWADYGAFCYDKWDEERDDEGSVIREAGDRYSFRREELLALIVRAHAAQFDAMESRVAALESEKSDSTPA